LLRSFHACRPASFRFFQWIARFLMFRSEKY
jgi:hypothetical protein